MQDEMLITKGQLLAAMLQWETDHRAGRTLSDAESLALPIDQRARESAATLWDFLLLCAPESEAA